MHRWGLALLTCSKQKTERGHAGCLQPGDGGDGERLQGFTQGDWLTRGGAAGVVSEKCVMRARKGKTWAAGGTHLTFPLSILESMRAGPRVTQVRHARSVRTT